MVRSALLGLLLLGLSVNICLGMDVAPLEREGDARYAKPGGGNGTCEDKWPEDKCIKLMEADKCEKVGKNCKKTCDMCDDESGEEGGGNGTCEDKWPKDKCIKLME